MTLTASMPYLILYLLPLLLAVLLIFSARRAKRKWLTMISAIAGGIAAALFVTMVCLTAPYFWAIHLESKWFPAHPQTRAEMESFLSLYKARYIQPAESEWGRDHVLRVGDRMVQYMIL